jgi:hypothetical protein
LWLRCLHNGSASNRFSPTRKGLEHCRVGRRITVRVYCADAWFLRLRLGAIKFEAVARPTSTMSLLSSAVTLWSRLPVLEAEYTPKTKRQRLQLAAFILPIHHQRLGRHSTTCSRHEITKSRELVHHLHRSPSMPPSYHPTSNPIKKYLPILQRPIDPYKSNS